MNEKNVSRLIKKWFKPELIRTEAGIVPTGNIESAAYPSIPEQAWEKTFTKWYLAGIHLPNFVFQGEVDSCGLCNLFYCRKNCKNCPIRMHTGRPYCKETPFTQFIMCPTADNLLAEILFLRKIQREDMN